MPDPTSVNVYTLKSVYEDAILQLKELKDDRRLSQADFDMITGLSQPPDVLALIADKMRYTKPDSNKKQRLFQIVGPSLLRLERFCSAIDVLAQSSPQMLGLNLVGLIWGSLKLMIVIVHDFVDTFDAVLALLSEVTNGLPALETYIKIFGCSDIRLLEIPLITMYVEIIMFGIQAVKLFDRSTIRTLWRSAWKSLRSDFELSIRRIKSATTEIDRVAQVEHMHESHQVRRVQQQEIANSEAFREELWTLFMTRASENSDSRPLAQLFFNDAPIDMLSVHFSGRNSELEILEKNLGETSANQPSRCAIHGMPGLGKTQMALQYTKRFFDSRSNAVVFWIPASSIEKINQSFSKILNLVAHPDRRHPEQSARQIAARRWLEEVEISGPINWLLVFDNVNIITLEFLREHLPRHGKHGQILFTTRTGRVAEALCEAAGQKYPTIELKVLDMPDATQLFLDDSETRSGQESSSLRSKVVQLVKYLGCLPLAINQAASLMKESYQSVDDLLESFHQDEKNHIFEWENNLSTYEAKSITATFTCLFDELRRLYPEANKLLKILAFFDQENIQLDMLVQGASALLPSRPAALPGPLPPTMGAPVRSREHRMLRKLFPKRGKSPHIAPLVSTVVPLSALDSVAPLLLSSTKLHAAIRQLQGLCLVKRRSMVNGGALYIHDLMQTMIQESLKTEKTRSIWFKGAVLIACESFLQIEDPQSPKCWGQCENLIPHINSLAIWNKRLGEESAELLEANKGVASYLRNRGRYSESENLYQEVLLGSEKQLGCDHADTITIVLSLARVFWDLGEYDKALTLYNRALKIRETNLGQDDLETLIVVESMANIHRSQGHFDEGEMLFNRVLVGRETKLGSNHPDTLQTLHNIAHVHRCQGRYSEAQLLYDRVLLGREKYLGHDHLETLWTVDDLANNYQSQGRYDEAVVLFNRVLTSRETQLGPDHPETLWAVDNIANVYRCLGRYLEAETLYNRALVRNETQLGYDHQETLWTVDGLAVLYLDQGRYREAKALFDRALSGREKRLGPEHHLTLRTVNSLARLFQKEENYLEAEKLFFRALCGRRAKLRPNHPDTVRTLHDLGNVYERQTRYDEAESCYRQALEAGEGQLSISQSESQDIVESLERVLGKKNQGN